MTSKYDVPPLKCPHKDEAVVLTRGYDVALTMVRRLWTVRHVVEYTCDYWMTFRAAATDVAMVTLERLQTECDMVLLRAVNSILSAHRSVSWGHMHDTVVSTSLRLKSTYAWLATIGRYAWLRLIAKPRLKSWHSLVHLPTRRKCATPGVTRLVAKVMSTIALKCQLLTYSLGGATQRWYRVIIKLTVNFHV